MSVPLFCLKVHICNVSSPESQIIKNYSLALLYIKFSIHDESAEEDVTFHKS